MANKAKEPYEVPAGALPFVLANPETEPNSGGTSGTSPKDVGIKSVKGRQTEAKAKDVAIVVAEAVKAALEKQKPKLEIKSK